MTTTTDRPTTNLVAFAGARAGGQPRPRPEPAANSLATPAQRAALSAEIEARLARDFQRLRNLGAHDAVDRVLAAETQAANREAEDRLIARLSPEALDARRAALALGLAGRAAETEPV